MENYTKQGEDFLKAANVKMSVKLLRYGKHFINDPSERYVFLVTFRRDKKQFSIQFGQSIASGNKKPSAYDVLACITKNDPGTIENFMHEYGYEYKPTNLYKRVLDEYNKVSNFFTFEEIDQLNDIN